MLDCGNAGCQVDTVPAAGGNLAPVSPPQFQDGAGLAWSPKGDEVLVGESSGVQACNVGTADVRSVAGWPDIFASSGADILDFSDDGRFAAVGTPNGSGVSLFVVALDGTSPTKDYILFWNTVGAFSVRFRHDR